MNAIEIRGLTKNFGQKQALSGLNMTVPVDGDIYMHLGSEIKRQCNVWIGIKDETGEYHGRNSTLYDGCGTYFETNSSPIVRLGKFAKGEESQVRFIIISTGPNNTYDGTDEYIMVRKNESDGGSGFHFYYLDREEFEKDINTLKAQQWEIDTDKSTERHLVGKVTAKANQLLVTSIPYEPGWTIKVDGKKLDTRIVEQEDEEGKVKLLNYDSGDGELILMDSVIGIRLGEGEHTVEMIYTPPGFKFGVVTLILGIGAIVMLYLYDRKKNSVLIARRKIKEQGASETDAEKAPEKKVQIIKSKGAVSENVITAKQEDSSKNDKKNDNKSEEKAPETEKSDEESETTEKEEE